MPITGKHSTLYHMPLWEYDVNKTCIGQSRIKAEKMLLEDRFIAYLGFDESLKIN